MKKFLPLNQFGLSDYKGSLDGSCFFFKKSLHIASAVVRKSNTIAMGQIRMPLRLDSVNRYFPGAWNHNEEWLTPNTRQTLG